VDPCNRNGPQGVTAGFFAGLQILELAQTAYSSYVAKTPHEQARLVKGKTGDWLAALDDFRNWLIREAA
jgi:hypothetical protein